MDKLVVPGTGVELVDGSIVILARFPGTKWIVHNGWYNYQGAQSIGWYFCAIPSQTVLPVSDEDLKLLTVVSDGSSCPCPPYPPPFPPAPLLESPPLPPAPSVPDPAPVPAFPPFPPSTSEPPLMSMVPFSSSVTGSFPLTIPSVPFLQ